MTKEELYYIRVYIANAYHNIEDGDGNIDYLHDQLFKAMQLITDLRRTKIIEAVNA